MSLFDATRHYREHVLLTADQAWTNWRFAALIGHPNANEDDSGEGGR